MNLSSYSPQHPFTQRHLLTLSTYSPDEILQLLSLALKLKQQLKAGIPHRLLEGKILGMIFNKPSARTRVSFEVGIHQLGGKAVVLSAQEIQMGKRETPEDIARLLSRYLDGIMIRTFAQHDVEQLAEYGTIPIINGLTDLLHPCQALADLMTIYEVFGDLAGRKLTFVGDGNNVAHSLMIICAKLGVHFAIAHPPSYDMDDTIIDSARIFAAHSGSTITITADPVAAVTDADAVYTDVFTSMGQEAETERRLQDFANYSITDDLMTHAKPSAIFLHCLPAHRGEEVSASVIDGPQSRVWDEAENRLHAQKAVMVYLLGQPMSQED